MRKLLIGCLFTASTAVSAQPAFDTFTLLSLIFQGVRFSMEESSPKEIIVTSKGTGKTQQEAIDSALFASVQKAIGVLVVSDQTVQNDKVIRNLVASYSSGIVNEYKINKCSGVPITCEVTAKVSPWKFMRRLEGEAQTIKVNGNDLAAQATTARNTLIHREKITRYYMSQIRQSGLDVIVRKLEIIPSTGKDVKLVIDYEVKWNKQFKDHILSYLKRLEKDTVLNQSENEQIYIQWAPTGMFDNRVRINTYDNDFRMMMEYYMFEPVKVKFNELDLCVEHRMDNNVFTIDWYGLRRQKTIFVNPDKLQNLQSISMQIGCAS